MVGYASWVKRRIPMMLLGLAILGVAWYLQIRAFGWPLTALIGAVIVVGCLSPARFSNLATGLGIVGIAALLHFRHGLVNIPILVGLFGLIDLGIGVRDVMAPTRSAGGDQRD